MKPILFNAQMVRAILDGRKTQTRRLVKTGSYTPLEIGRSKFYTFCDELNGKSGAWAGFYCNRDVFIGRDGKQHIDAVYAKLPYQPGDILWVRETWSELKYPDGSRRYVYKASDEYPFGEDGYIVKFRWHPSIHMPREAARIFLRVMDVRVERLQDITIDDAIAEGCNEIIPITEFRLIWSKTIKPADRDRYGWNANPWVCVISFERYYPADPEGGSDGLC